MAHRDGKRNTAYALLALLAAVLVLVYFAANQDDYYRSAIPAEAFTAMEDGTAAVQSGRLMLEKGEYTFTVSYAAAADGAAALLINDLAADDLGNPSPVLQSVALDPGQTVAVLPLTLSRTTRGIRLVLQGAAVTGAAQVLSNGPVWHDTAFFLLAMVLTAALFWWLRRRRADREGFPESLALAVCVIAGGVASLPALRDFLVYGHDLAFHLTRIESIKDGLLSGQFPVRIDPTFVNGYGYAASVMYGDLLLYVPALFRLCGVSMMVSWQAFVVLLNVATAYVAYRAVRAWTGRAEVGLIAGVLYTLGVYRLMTLFTRAAAGEALAMLFYPPVIVGIVQVVRENKGMKWLVIGMTGMLQTHLISLQIAAIGCALYTLACVVLRKTSWKAVGRLCAAAGLTILINLWFLVPLFTFSALHLDIFRQQKQIWLHAAYLPQLFASFVDPYAGMTTFPGTTAEMPLSVGLLQGFGLVLLLFAAYKQRGTKPEDAGLLAAGRGTALFAALALAMASVAFPWTYLAKIPVLGKAMFAVQFPWRYLGAASALLSIVFAVSSYLLAGKPEHRRMLVLGCLLLAILNAAPFLDAAVQSDKQQVIVADKYADFVAPVYLPGDYFFDGADGDACLRRAPAPDVTAGDAALSAYEKDALTISFDYAAQSKSTVELPLYGYPTYRATLDGTSDLALSKGDHSILTVTLPAGGGHVKVAYSQPWYFTAADFLSLLAILALAAWSIAKKRRQKTTGP